MKYILHIAAKLHIGGAEKVARDIGLYPDPSEYQNHYVVFGEEIGDYEKQLTAYGCKIFHMDSPAVSYRKFLTNLKELMRAYPYTAVHAHTMFNAGWVMYQAKRMGVPVRIAHSHSALDTGGGWKVKIYETLMRRLILSCATDLVACGKKAGIRLFGAKAYEQRAELIRNGVDTERFRFDPEGRSRIRRELGLEENFVIGHTGHLAEVKNQKFLIDRMPDILKRKPEAKLVLLGEGPDRPMLQKRIEELGLQNQVILTGNVTNVAEYLSAMDIFAFPSLYEGMPLSILEVQANGLNCVLSTGVPKDVYLTDLITPLPLSEPECWVEEICKARRIPDRGYAGRLKAAGYDLSGTMNKIYGIYEKN